MPVTESPPAAAQPVATLPSIRKARAYRLRMPLKQPYENALGRLDAFDVLLFELEDDQGRQGWGEACPVAGYSPEDPDQAWAHANQLLPQLVAGADGIEERLGRDLLGYPFVVSAIHEAIDDLAGSETLAGNGSECRVELAGTVNTLDPVAAAEAARKLVDAGYRTLKVKVGYHADDDARRVRAIAAAVDGAAQLRMDANQGYDLASAIAFARQVPLAAVEVFEQPVPAHRWDLLEEIAAQEILPVMLDESIYGDADIEYAAGLRGVTAVKLKLGKAGGPTALARQVDLGHRLGLRVVVGNGVASDLGCYHEALCYQYSKLATAGELNGFLKTTSRLLRDPLTVEGAWLRVPAQARLEVMRGEVESLAVATTAYP